MDIQASIIIRTFNEQKYIAKLLRSLSRQNYKNFEVIIVDSESTDNTVRLAREFEGSFEHFKLLHMAKARFTFGRSLNVGVGASQGKFIVAISGHCIPKEDNWLAELLKPLESGKAEITYGRQIGLDEKDEFHPSTRFSERNIFGKNYPATSEVTEPFLNNANGAFSRKLWEELRFDENLPGLEDLDFAIRASLLSSRSQYVATSVVYHLHDEDNSRVFNRFFREEIALLMIDSKRFNKGKIEILCSLIKDLGSDFKSAFNHKDGIQRFYVSIVGYRLAQYFAIYTAHYRSSGVYQNLENVHDKTLRWITRDKYSLRLLDQNYGHLVEFR